MTGRKNGGFTLVELLVSILAASIVTLAATSVLLLGVRINGQSTGVVTRQNTARVFMTALENMAAEGTITRVTDSTDGWNVWDASGNSLIAYSAEEGAIYTGTATTPFVEDILESHASIDDNGLLTCTVETEEGAYRLEVYCRTMDTTQAEERTAYVGTLISQLRSGDAVNDGYIVGGTNDGILYAKWFSGSLSDATPWCACFVSWGLVETGQDAPYGFVKWFADVDQYVAYLQSNNEEGHSWKASEPHAGTYIPAPGDLIFFNTDGNQDPDGPNDTDHMGVVISVAGGYVYTIEGNVEVSITNEDNQPETINIVQLKKYELNNGTIQGYGVLNWD